MKFTAKVCQPQLKSSLVFFSSLDPPPHPKVLGRKKKNHQYCNNIIINLLIRGFSYSGIKLSRGTVKCTDFF